MPLREGDPQLALEQSTHLSAHLIRAPRDCRERFMRRWTVLTNQILPRNTETGINITCISQMKKLICRERKQLAHGHTAGKQGSNLRPSNSNQVQLFNYQPWCHQLVYVSVFTRLQVFCFCFTFILERQDGKGIEQHPVFTSGEAGLFMEGSSFKIKYVQPPGVRVQGQDLNRDGGTREFFLLLRVQQRNRTQLARCQQQCPTYVSILTLLD